MIKFILTNGTSSSIKNTHSNKAITLTFGEAGENHVGMEMIGKRGEKGSGFKYEDLIDIKNKLEYENIKCELIDLRNLVEENIRKYLEEAYILIMYKCGDYFVDNSNSILLNEMDTFEWDTKMYCNRRKKVLNKHARSNVCFDSINREPKYEDGKGRIVGYDNVPYLKQLREKLELLNPKCKEMICEGNQYYDINKCGIGWHGDSERHKVIALRLGAKIPLKYRWYKNSIPIGKSCTFMLGEGDMYIMSEKATGFDWKRRSIYTLRHSAGCEKYTKDK